MSIASPQCAEVSDVTAERQAGCFNPLTSVKITDCTAALKIWEARETFVIGLFNSLTNANTARARLTRFCAIFPRLNSPLPFSVTVLRRCIPRGAEATALHRVADGSGSFVAHQMQLLKPDFAMATRMNMLKLLQEMRGFSELSRLPLTPKPPALFLMQLRNKRAESQRPRHRLVIQIDLQDQMEMPMPVKITHVAPKAAEQAA